MRHYIKEGIPSLTALRGTARVHRTLPTMPTMPTMPKRTLPKACCPQHPAHPAQSTQSRQGLNLVTSWCQHRAHSYCDQ